jgi:hypothetical protein
MESRISQEADGSPVTKRTHWYSGVKTTRDQEARKPNEPIPSIAKRLVDDWKKPNSVALQFRPCEYTQLGISLTKGARGWVVRHGMGGKN